MPFHAVLTLAILVADANTGAKLVAQNGCQACHGTTFRGTTQFPALYGIEHRLSRAQIAAALTSPKAPMPNYGFSTMQASDIADYLCGLDGGMSADQPVVTFAPAHPVNYADVTVRFRGAAPRKVTAVASMSMGSMAMKSPPVTFAPTADPHVYKARIAFAMSGAWTIHIVYDGKTIDRPLVIGQ